jgi:hypothetical protein
MKQKTKAVIFFYNLNHLGKVHMRIHQYQVREQGSHVGLGENGFARAPGYKGVGTD